MNPAQIETFFATLQAANPHPQTELEFSSVFELLTAVLLSAQATDVGVNKATRRLFVVANTPQKILDLGHEGLERHIKTIGLYRSKARHLMETCRMLVEHFDGQVPRTREALESLPGVGRKTANVVLNVAFGEPTMAVDTHLFRLGNRTGQDTARGGRQAAQTHTGRLYGGCPPLADIAWPLYLPGAQAAVLAMCGQRGVRFQAQDSVARLSRWHYATGRLGGHNAG
jgi:endonuclease-3